MNIPRIINSEQQLEQILAEPYSETVALMGRLKGDIMILGAGGKMGPSLAHLALNASRYAGADKRIFAVSRFSDSATRTQIETWGLETIISDFSRDSDIRALPDAENIIFMAGRKFGSTGSESETWVMNTIVPAAVAQRFAGARIVVFSTGCVYDLVSRNSGGSVETDPPSPVGEYAYSCLGRERIFEYYSGLFGTSIVFFRLNYAVDLRYGVLVDIARSVFSGQPIDISVNDVNVIWQGDANNRALLALEYAGAPPPVLNITGNEILSVSAIAEKFGALFGVPVQLIGTPVDRSYLSNAQKSIDLFGRPRISEDVMIRWIADWIRRGGVIYGKPTLFHVTDGNYLT
jgi:nucleoside-diphosphate-sugar epimerase